ncbi:MAG: ParB/RepB/Spo0J family partition protein, partial [Firmicutes bacterium]|nr:ParB/RepB/Spo0J family partition protein [Bacillota bacterium]
MAKSRGLGRGLSALIAGAGSEIVPDKNLLKEVAIDAIDPNPFQPRKSFDDTALQELAQSIAHHGLLQPILVRPVGARYQLIAGERRLRAVQILGQTTILVRSYALSDEEALQVALIENLQRADLNVVEEASAYERLIREFSWTQQAVAEQVGKARSHIANMIRILQLDEEILELIRTHQLSIAHGKVLLTCPEELRMPLAHKAA